MEPLRISDYQSSQMQDSMVVRRILSGEKELFEILVRRYNQTLFRIVRGYLQNDDDVEDVMQNTYLKSFDKLQQFQGNSTFSTWLVRIGINESLLRIRELKRKKAFYISENEVPQSGVIQITDSKQMNPEKLTIAQETRMLIERAIDQLPEKYRVIYILKEVEGLENTEIENCLGITESNIKVRLHRAKNLLKDSLYKLHYNEDIFTFGNSRCDRMVNNIMKLI